MTVAAREIPFGEFVRSTHTCTRRWQTGNAAGWQAAHVSVGWLPDGTWWVEDTRRQHVTLLRGDDQEQVRRAALAHAETLMVGGGWVETIATFEPGVMPARAAEVPEWPPGHEPG